jgi:hypothetical protein
MRRALRGRERDYLIKISLILTQKWPKTRVRDPFSRVSTLKTLFST